MLIRNLRIEREKRGWSLEYVGRKVGITKISLQAIETCKTNPSYRVLVKLEKLFSPLKHDYLLKEAKVQKKPAATGESKRKI